MSSAKTNSDERRTDIVLPNWVAIDHVQLAIPVGGEDAARRFYVEVLGFTRHNRDQTSSQIVGWL